MNRQSILLKKHTWLLTKKLYDVTSGKISLFMFLYHHLQNLPHSFTDFLIANSQIHQYSTQNPSKLHMHYHRTNYTKHSLSVKGVDVWNNLDVSLTKITSLPIFKTNRKYIL